MAGKWGLASGQKTVIFSQGMLLRSGQARFEFRCAERVVNAKFQSATCTEISGFVRHENLLTLSAPMLYDFYAQSTDGCGLSAAVTGPMSMWKRYGSN